MPAKQLDFRPMNSPLSSNELKIQEKLKPTNEVVYHTASSTDFSKTIETTSELESTSGYTSNEKYTLPEDSTKKNEFSSKAQEYKTSNSDFTFSTTDEISQIDINLKYEISSTDFSKIIETTSNSESTTSDDKSTSTEKNDFTTYSEDYTSVTTINTCETAKLTHLDVTPSPFSLNITWINSVNVDCDFIYEIQSINEVFYNTTTNSFVFVNYLNACEYYEGVVSILYYKKPIHSKRFNATTSKAVDSVEQLKYQVTESQFLISWLPSIRTTSCIKYYKWKHYQDGKLVEENKNVTSMNVIIPQPDGCLNNTFSVLAAINDSFLSLPQSITYIDVKVNDPPTFASAQMSANNATTKWTFEKICKPQLFLVKFTSDNENFTIIEDTIQLENNEIIAAEVNGLLAFTNYSFYGAIANEVGVSKWSDISPTFQTHEMEPDPPENLTIKQLENHTLYISWEQPQKWNGKEISYILTIKFIELNYTAISGCPEIPHKTTPKELDYNINIITTDFVEPASLFTISINAKSSGGIGSSIQKDIITNEAVPDEPNIISHNFQENSLKNKYNVTLHVEWSTPCRVNGIVSHYRIQLSTCDNSSDNEYYIIPITSAVAYNYSFENLLADSCYNFIVQLHSQSNYNRTQLSVTSPAGIPDILETVDIPIPNAEALDNPETTANVYIKNNMFNSTMGEIIYYAIIVAQTGCEETPISDLYSLDAWPKVVGNELCSDESKAYQATKIKWNPFLMDRKYNADLKVFVLGTAKDCTSDFCNRPLTPNTNYSIKIRGFTKRGFSDTQLIYFNTASFVDGFQLGLILGLIFGILAIAFIIAAALFYTKGKLNFTGWPRMESTSNISPAPLPVPLKKFKTHYAKMIENSGKIKNEFQLLSTISSDVTLSTKTAMLPINRKKNRYINILPYDQTRVKLNDASITASDYINASYIKGYSEYNEYIATQGPTESTSAAFWQMIIEQNVKLIVMLTQFVESGKEKCHKYFPDLNDSQNYLNVITVECIEEKLLPNFNRRTFKVTKGKDVKTIIHLQFNLWPDFGVPHELDYIIEFNKIIKEIKLKKPFLSVMHCSAGVGRTGTLIAVDILMQTIRDKRKVDIFGTVLNLRKQRMNMVQSEIQYEFLYQCVNFLLSDNSRNLKSSYSHSKIQLDQIDECQITESNMLQTFNKL